MRALPFMVILSRNVLSWGAFGPFSTGGGQRNPFISEVYRNFHHNSETISPDEMTSNNETSARETER